MPMVQDILIAKGNDVMTIAPTMDVLEAVRLMNRHRIGSLVVLDREEVVGMFTERDVLKALAGTPDLRGLTVRDLMTRDVVTIAPTMDIADVSEEMRTRRLRHLPVLDHNAHLCGLISIGDVNAWHAEFQARQIDGLSEYIHGRA